MLPKVATHILHTTSRAAAQAVQTPLRNVLQTGSSSGSNLGNRNGPGGSNWGNHGPGTGSTKQNTGSRYYSSFNTAGRAVSQANAVSANVDGTFAQSDENDDHSRRVVVIQTQPQSQSQSKRPRIRSSSVSLTKAESLGVLKTIQLHGRSRFLHSAIEAAPQAAQFQPLPEPPPSRPRRNSTSSSDGIDGPVSPARNFSVAAVESGSSAVDGLPLRPRRNSTSSIDELEGIVVEPPKPLPKELARRTSTSSPSEYERSEVSSAETKLTTPPRSPRVSRPTTPTSEPSPSSRYQYLIDARDSGDAHDVAEAVARFRTSAKDPNTADFNIALEALHMTRDGESVIPMLETYDDMIKRSILPDDKTYTLLLYALMDREYELSRTIRSSSELKHNLSFHGGGLGGVKSQSLEERIDILASEHKDVLSSLLSLYYASKVAAPALPSRVYHNLIRTCAYTLNIDTAVEVFRRIEQLGEKMRPYAYQYLIQAYGNTNNIAAAEKVFQSYITAGHRGKLVVDAFAIDYQKKHILCWNAMIEAYFHCGFPDKAIEILDRMMNSPSGIDFDLAGTPLPSAATFTEVIVGFCRMGDVQTAYTWYQRLLEQGVEVDSSWVPSDQPTKPDHMAGITLMNALAEHGHIHELNKIYPTLDLEHFEMQYMHTLAYSANMRAVESIEDTAEARRLLEFLSVEVMPRFKKIKFKKWFAARIGREYLKRGLVDEALVWYTGFCEKMMEEVRNAHEGSPRQGGLMMAIRASFSEFQDIFFAAVVERSALRFGHAMMISQLARFLGVDVPRKVYKHVLHAYAVAKADGQLSDVGMGVRDWERLVEMALDVENSSIASEAVGMYGEVPGYAFGGVYNLVGDLAGMQVEIGSFMEGLMGRTIRHLVSVYGPEHVVATFQDFGPAFQRALEESEEIRMLVAQGRLMNAPQNVVEDGRTQALMGTYGNLTVNAGQTKAIEEALKHNNVRSEVLDAYARLKQGLKQRKVPAPRVLGRLIQGLGRQSELDKVKEVYAVAQDILKGLEMQPDVLRDGWVCVEDSMIIALAHAGDLDNAHIHRVRIIEQGVAPSADAYGALILYVKDTTDDASNAMTLYREAEQVNVEMNIYLYNNIISKLAKARKADHALEMFQRMKAQGVKPTSITYGALIGACARVGDVQSAEALFAEMVEQRNFKPRVPPYNTMMQLYTMTKPNRERALWFYEQMGVVGVKPTAHTYKLLLDAYGSIEPVDIVSMEAVFEELKNDRTVNVQGTHYASLINAYGCVQRDLGKAIAVFDSISSSGHSALDAVVFESIINVLVSHRRMDLVPEYMSKMTTAGVHMTAYIANFLIKGYAIVGDLNKAREMFESLVDPPTGFAAPNNHAPHDPSTGSNVGWMEPVYREPSTWEAMVRAELGAGYRDRALDLLERLKARQYPEAVYNRISGVMVDHSTLLA
ncbi:hypothetical protein P691DRAFT_760170 [Macrolepiota fuliginosa MF-IS2]|uniref:PROP1-like PPR domain-containing protein n=1 Tax=Macrolepiota fuliginosa MF-IS2 TaxID=1400762 RepID=A0A9P6C473_9AGAR|nr:hypothetical protein P691DRAFT_760170 [Macrolepiota fuliginosa MF-IS2]